MVASACATAPASFADVALVEFGRCPAANHLILDGLTNALPGLKPYLEQAARQCGTDDFTTLINQTMQLVADASKAENKKQK